MPAKKKAAKAKPESKPHWFSREVERFVGARRLVYFELEEAVELEEALPLRFDAARGSVRSLRVVEQGVAWALGGWLRASPSRAAQ